MEDVMPYLLVAAVFLVSLIFYFVKPQEAEKVRVPVNPTVSRKKKM